MKTLFLLLFFFSNSYADLRFILVRHGQSTHNIEQVYNANINHRNYKPSFLTSTGIAAIEQTCQKLKEQDIQAQNIVMAFVSPLPRTIQTAAILTKYGIIDPQRLKIDQRLIDDNPGEKEGKTTIGENSWDHSKAHDYGGENNDDVTKRVTEFINEVKKQYTDGDILIISHGTPIGLMLNVLLDCNYILGDPAITLPTAGYKIISIKE
jgi:broad specificity phosphatase PhoE